MSMDRQMRLDPYPMYEQMRANAPVLFNPDQGAWLVYKYDDVKRVISEPQTFSSDVFAGMQVETLLENSMQAMDPPRHTKLRALATHAFSPRVIAEMETRIRTIATELVDAMEQKGSHADFVKDFNEPLPVIVIAEMLGIPVADRTTFKYWSDIVVENAELLLAGQMPEEEHVVAYREMKAYFLRMTQERRLNPRGDLISSLAHAEIEGQRLTDAEVIDFCILLMVAGNETTTNLLSNAQRCFLENPDQWELLRREPTLIPQAIEEVMRYRSPVQCLFRIATRDVELGGQQIKAGQQVAVFVGSANRDETRAEDANRFDITRKPGAHVGFGHGIHFCLGAPLARLEAKVALEVLSARIPSFELVEGGELEPLSTFIVFGLKQLPVRFTTKVEA